MERVAIEAVRVSRALTGDDLQRGGKAGYEGEVPGTLDNNAFRLRQNPRQAFGMVPHARQVIVLRSIDTHGNADLRQGVVSKGRRVRARCETRAVGLPGPHQSRGTLAWGGRPTRRRRKCRCPFLVGAWGPRQRSLARPAPSRDLGGATRSRQPHARRRSARNLLQPVPHRGPPASRTQSIDKGSPARDKAHAANAEERQEFVATARRAQPHAALWVP